LCKLYGIKIADFGMTTTAINTNIDFKEKISIKWTAPEVRLLAK